MDIDTETLNEYNRLKAYANSNGESAALLSAADTIAKLRRALAELRACKPIGKEARHG